jgi:hypothetical protein
MIQWMYLVGGDWNMFCLSIFYGNFIIPTDEETFIFFRGVGLGIPPTSYDLVLYIAMAPFLTMADDFRGSLPPEMILVILQIEKPSTNQEWASWIAQNDQE